MKCDDSSSKDKDIPKHLYKYVSTMRALEILLTKEVYFAHRKKFNDPLDGKIAEENSSGKNRKGEKIKDLHLEIALAKEMIQDVKDGQNILDNADLGFFSMSENDKSYPMWAHYADEHKGCCLKFNLSHLKSDYDWNENFPFVFVKKVDYSYKLPTLDTAKTIIPHHEGSVYMTKHEDWRYEKEWRAVMYKGVYKLFGKELFDPKNSSFQGSGSYKMKKKFVEKIILGKKMEKSERDAVIVAADKCEVEVIEADIED